MKISVWTQIEEARKISRANPILGYNLERQALASVGHGFRNLPTCLEWLISRYSNLIKTSSVRDTIRHTKDLCRIVSPYLDEKINDSSVRIQASIPIVRYAHSHPELRKELLPIIYKLTGR